MKRRTGGACTPNIIPTPRPSRRCCPQKRGTRSGVPLGVGVELPVRGVDLWLDVNDPRLVAEVAPGSQDPHPPPVPHGYRSLSTPTPSRCAVSKGQVPYGLRHVGRNLARSV